MKRIILLLAFFTGLQFISHGQEENPEKYDRYEYMTIISEFTTSKFLRATITEPDGKVEQIGKDSFKKKFQYLETTAVIDLLEKYSDEGWIVVSSNMLVEGGDLNFYYLLKRKK